MKLLTFNMHYPGSGYKDYLNKLLGVSFHSDFHIEINATAGNQFIKVNLLNFKEDLKLFNVLKNDQFVFSVYVHNRNHVKQIKPPIN
jgi:hypothetical protein